MRCLNFAALFAGAFAVAAALTEALAAADQASQTADDRSTRKKGHHHHHHHKHRHKHHKHHKKKGDAQAAVVKDADKQDTKAATNASATASSKTATVVKANVSSAKVAASSKAKVNATKINKEDAILQKMKALEAKIAKKGSEKQGRILVNGPLPADFAERFVQSVAAAIGVDTHGVVVKSTTPSGNDGIMMVTFASSPRVVDTVEDEAADPDSKLANGNLHSFLVAKAGGGGGGDDSKPAESESEEPAASTASAPPGLQAEPEATPVEEKGIDIDTAMPYGDLEPFGREDTAQELTEDSIKESDGMVDQLERAEVSEEKRAVFRALTRLRGAAITSFDGVARSQTGNIDEYNKVHQWRATHPLHHLADEESDVSKWAFPDNADF
jgi:hypothetical protein